MRTIHKPRAAIPTTACGLLPKHPINRYYIQDAVASTGTYDPRPLACSMPQNLCARVWWGHWFVCKWKTDEHILNLMLNASNSTFSMNTLFKNERHIIYSQGTYCVRNLAMRWATDWNTSVWVCKQNASIAFWKALKSNEAALMPICNQGFTPYFQTYSPKWRCKRSWISQYKGLSHKPTFYPWIDHLMNIGITLKKQILGSRQVIEHTKSPWSQNRDTICYYKSIHISYKCICKENHLQQRKRLNFHYARNPHVCRSAV